MNKLIYPGISILNVSDEIVNLFLKFIEKREKDKDFPIYDYLTINGNQTENLLHLIHNNTCEGEALIELKNMVDNHIHTKFQYTWIHAISYDSNGYQNKHKHNHNEDCSFILFLNNCDDGETNFYVNEFRNIQYKIKPERGKLVIFFFINTSRCRQNKSK